MTSVSNISSSLPTDTTEARYQKAIKEITKLISINNELKDEGKKNSVLITSLKDEIKEVTYQLQVTNEEK